MPKPVFEPNYKITTYLGYFFVPALELFLLWQIIFENNRDLTTINMAVLCGLLIAVMPYMLIRRIIFGEISFTVEKYFWLAKTIKYIDVIDFGMTVIKTQNGNISLWAITNSHKAYNMFTALVEEGKIGRYQVEHQVYRQEVVSRKAFLPAILVSLVLQILLSSIWKFENSTIQELSIIVIFLPVYFMTYLFLKNRAENL